MIQLFPSIGHNVNISLQQPGDDHCLPPYCLLQPSRQGFRVPGGLGATLRLNEQPPPMAVATAPLPLTEGTAPVSSQRITRAKRTSICGQGAHGALCVYRIRNSQLWVTDALALVQAVSCCADALADSHSSCKAFSFAVQ